VVTVVSTDTTAPVTTISLAGTTLTVSAADETGGSGVLETRCVLDPASPPTSFAKLPSACPYLGGASVPEGRHVLYAASEDLAGNTELPIAKMFVIDTTPPTIVFTGNAGAYGVLDTVVITCSASDEVSGIASSTCPDVNAPAYSFGPGPETLTASATDNAGNAATASTSFTVTATYADLCTLTQQFSAKKNTNDLCKLLLDADQAAASGDLTRKQRDLGQYVSRVTADSTRNDKAARFTAAQASTLIAFAQSL
jgi:hypothetical protein